MTNEAKKTEFKTLTKEEVTKIKTYIESKTVLLVDPSVGSRSNIKKCLMVLGCHTEKIDEADSLKIAQELFEKKKHSVIISEYRLGQESGLRLCEPQVEAISEFSERVFILSMGDATESILVEATEEDVDYILLKPYSIGSLTKAVTETLLSKVETKEYKKEIENGKKLYRSQKNKEALQVFQKASTLDEKPFLAWFYLGKTYEHLQDEKNALSAFQKALEFNSKHYKTLSALVDFYRIKDLKNEAYNVTKKILEFYPIHAKILLLAFELAVFTKNYEDIHELFSLFIKIESKTEEMNKKVSAAFIVAASFYLRKNKTQEAFDALQKAISVSGKQDWVLLESALCLYRYEQPEKADEFLAMVTLEEKEKETFKKISFYVYSQLKGPEDYSVAGRKLLLDGIVDREVSQITLRGLKKLNKMDVYQQVLENTKQKIPDFSET